MKSVKLRSCIALICVMAMLLSACGGAKGKENSKGNTPSKENTTATDMNSIEMPTADLSNNSKVLNVFCWSTMEENETDGVAAEYFEKEFGVELKETISTHENYWSDLAKMVAAGNAPDVVDCAYDKFYPLPVSNDLLLPIDDYFDFSSPLWADTKEITEQYKWKGKTYFPVISEFLQCWVYYNKAMYKNYGMEDQMPWDLYVKGEWTFDKFLEQASAFVEKDNKNQVTQWGVTVQNLEFLSIAGEQIFGINGGTEYVNNMRSKNIAKVMNGFQSLSPAGTGAVTGMNAVPTFTSGQVAMLISQANVYLSSDLDTMREKNQVGFAPLPKLDDEIGHCTEVAIDPGYGIIKGAKNIDLAVLWINYLKWFRLGENFCVYIPNEENTPAKEKYNLKQAGGAQYTAEEVKMIEDFIASKPKKVYVTYRSIARNMDRISTLRQVMQGTQWSTLLQELYPVIDSELKGFIK